MALIRPKFQKIMVSGQMNARFSVYLSRISEFVESSSPIFPLNCICLPAIKAILDFR